MTGKCRETVRNGMSNTKDCWANFFLESKLFDSIENRFDVQKDKASGSLQSGLITGFK